MEVSGGGHASGDEDATSDEDAGTTGFGECLFFRGSGVRLHGIITRDHSCSGERLEQSMRELAVSFNFGGRGQTGAVSLHVTPWASHVHWVHLCRNFHRDCKCAQTVKSDTSDSESNGSGSSEEEDIGKEISFYIYQNRKGIPSKHFIKERVNWRNSYQLQLKLRKVVDGRATIVYDATSMVKKLETGMDQTIQTLKAQLANKAEEAKAAGILKKDKLKRSKTSRDNSGGYWRGNYIRRH